MPPTLWEAFVMPRFYEAFHDATHLVGSIAILKSSEAFHDATHLVGSIAILRSSEASSGAILV